ncbi:MAG: hypothetical protein J6D30_03330 [Clostridia bacterium]|nr:hypothetical protein [Clostridia bacterium]
MENQINQQELLTKANSGVVAAQKTQTEKPTKGVLLSVKEAEEFRAYKRRKAVEEIMAGMQKSAATLTTEAELPRVCERALRLKQAAIKMPLTRMSAAKKRLGKSKIKFDCLIGGDGETSTKIKAYETREAIRLGAEEITVVITPSYITASKFEEIRRELRAIRRVAKRKIVKAAVFGELSLAVYSRLARLVSEVGLQFFCIYSFSGCEKLRFDLINGCKLEIMGIQTLQDFKRMLTFNVGRIVTDSAWEIYGAWLQEADKIEFAKMLEKAPPKEELPEKPSAPVEEPAQAAPTDKPCVEPKQTTPLPVSKVVEKNGIPEQKPTAVGIEGSELKFM